MPAFVKNSGSWKSVKNIFVKDSGSWKSVKGGWVKDNGIWKKFYASGPPVPTSLTTSIVNLPNARDYTYSAANGVDRVVFISYQGDNTGFAVTTTDGTAWTESPLPNLSPQSFGYVSVKYGNGVFIACGFESSIVARSVNGINWSNAGSAVFPGGFCDIEYGQGNFIIFDNYGGYANMSSNNGTSWSSASNFNNCIWGAAFGNNTWVALYDPSDVSKSSFFYSTTNGATWLRTNLPYSSYSQPVSFANNMFFSVVFGSSNNGLYYSTNGISWSKATGSIGTALNYTNVVYGDGVYMSYDLSRKGIIWSTNGTSWNFYSDSNTLGLNVNTAGFIQTRLLCFCPGLGFFVAGSGKVLRASPVF